jgi:hypothetical protein
MFNIVLSFTSLYHKKKPRAFGKTHGLNGHTNNGWLFAHKNRGDKRRPRSIDRFVFEANTCFKQDAVWIDGKQTTLVPLQNLVGFNPDPVAHCILFS